MEERKNPEVITTKSKKKFKNYRTWIWIFGLIVGGFLLFNFVIHPVFGYINGLKTEQSQLKAEIEALKANPAENVTAPTTNENSQLNPRTYNETGKGKTFTFEFEVKDGEYGIVGGYIVNGSNNGNYLLLTPGIYKFQVTDGFYLVTDKENAVSEWNFRLEQAKSNNWAMQHVDAGPLADK